MTFDQLKVRKWFICFLDDENRPVTIFQKINDEFAIALFHTSKEPHHKNEFPDVIYELWTI
jgi:hypothetical protein